MQYDVYLDDIFFYGVTDFSFSGDRELVVYNGIGLGYFPKADDPNLRTWSWTCELQERAEHYHDNNFRKASEIFRLLENLKSSKDPSRLVVKGESKSLSEQVLLEGYTYKELYNGVYQVAVNVTEYKEAAVRTTTIPEIPRPGKIPVGPVVTIDDDETAYDKTTEAEESWTANDEALHDPGGGTIHDPVNDVFIDTETGQEVAAPVDPDPDDQYYINNITGEAVKVEGGFADKINNAVDDFFHSAWEGTFVSGIVSGDFFDAVGDVASGIGQAVGDVIDGIQQGYEDFKEWANNG